MAATTLNSSLNAGNSPAKNIFVYRNGDTNFQCKRIVVNPREIKNWNSFIELITARVKAKNGGAVRRVFTPTGRTKVTELSNIENNHFYVAAGVEGFQRHEYNKISGLPSQRTRLKLPPIIKPVQHSRLKVSARCKRAAISVGSKVIYVFRNGDANSPAVKILFTKFMLKNYDVVLNEVTRKVNIMTGAVWKLHTLEGKQLTGPEEMDDHEFYVACGRETFKKVPYPKDGVIVSPRVTRPPQIRRRVTRQSKDSKHSKDSKPSQQKQVHSQVGERKSKPSKPAKPAKPAKKPTPPKTKAEKSEEQKEAEEVFHSKPTMVKRSREKDHRNSLDFSDDPEGVFKAKEERDETKDAAEVQETQDTAIDLPIDQVAAEEVDDEEIKDETEAEPERKQATPTPEPPKLEPVDLVERMLDDKEEEQNEEEPAGYYSKRTPVISKQSPIIAGTLEDADPTSPTQSNGRAQSPNDNNNNSAESRKSPFQSQGGDDLAEREVKADSVPPSPARSNGRAASPIVNNDNEAENREEPPQNGDGPASFSPHPPAKDRSATRTPSAASHRKTQTPVENRSPSVASRNVPSRGRESQARDSPQSPKKATPPASPVPSNRRTQTPRESSSPKPEGRATPSQNGDAPSSPQPSVKEASTPPSPAHSNGGAQSPVENKSPSALSRDDPPQSGGGKREEEGGSPQQQPSDDVTNDNPADEAPQDQESTIPQKNIENGGVVEPLEGEIAA